MGVLGNKFDLLKFSGIAILFMLTFPFYSDLKFLFISLLCQFIICSNIYFRNDYELCISKIFFPWILLIVFSFLSSIWATNPSLVWYESLSYLLLLVVAFCTSLNFEKIENPSFYLDRFLAITFYIFLFKAFLCIIIYAFIGDNVWRNIFGNNSNYSTALLVMLFPFAWKILNKNKSKLLLIPFTLFVIGYTETKGCLLGFVIVLTSLFVLRKKPFNLLLLTILSLFLLGSGLIVYPLSDLINILDSGRLFMISSSIDLFHNTNWLGAGQSNWILEAYNRDLTTISGGPFNYADRIFRPRNHNLLSKIIAELGIIGLCLFLFSVYGFVRSIANKFSLSSSYVAATLGFLFMTNYYCTLYNFEYHFSELLLLFFMFVGIAKSNVKSYEFKNGLIVLFLLNSLILMYTSFSTYNRVKFNLSQDLKSEGNYEGALSELMTIYHPLIYTNYDANTPLGLSIGELNSFVAKYSVAKEYFANSLTENPNNIELLLAYANFEYNNGDILYAKKLGEKAYFIQRNNFKINELLFKIGLRTDDFSLAYKHLDRMKAFVVMDSYKKYKHVASQMNEKFKLKFNYGK